MGEINFVLTNAPQGAEKWFLSWWDGQRIHYTDPNLLDIDDVAVIQNAGLNGSWTVAIRMADGSSVNSGNWRGITADDGATYEIDGTTWEIERLGSPIGEISYIIYQDPRTGNWEPNPPSYYVVGEIFDVIVAYKNLLAERQYLYLDVEVTGPDGAEYSWRARSGWVSGGEVYSQPWSMVLNAEGNWTIDFVLKQ